MLFQNVGNKMERDLILGKMENIYMCPKISEELSLGLQSSLDKSIKMVSYIWFVEGIISFLLLTYFRPICHLYFPRKPITFGFLNVFREYRDVNWDKMG